MKKLVMFFVSLIIFTAVGGCQQLEPVLPQEEEDSLRESLGYVIAPTWLPEGLQFSSYTPPERGEMHILTYGNGEHDLILDYPTPMPYYLGGENFLLESLGLDWQPPDDSVATFKVNDEYAYMIYGMWSEETLNALVTLDEDLATMTPEWDYDFYKTLRFYYNLPSGERVNVRLFTMFDTGWISDDEMLKIAESCVEVEADQ